MKYFCRICVLTFFVSVNAYAAESSNVDKFLSFKIKFIEFYKKQSNWDNSYKPKWLEKFVNKIENKYKEEIAREESNRNESNKNLAQSQDLDKKTTNSREDKSKILDSLPKIELPIASNSSGGLQHHVSEKEVVKLPEDHKVEKVIASNSSGGLQHHVSEKEVVKLPEDHKAEKVIASNSSGGLHHHVSEKEVVKLPEVQKAEKSLVNSSSASVVDNKHEENKDILAIEKQGDIKVSNLVELDKKSEEKLEVKSEKIISNEEKIENKLTTDIEKQSEVIAEKDIKPDLQKYDPKYQEQLRLAEEKKKQDQEELDKFIKNEVTMLVLPHDDVYLGKETISSKIEHSDNSEFFKMFWKVLDNKKVNKEAAEIRKYIAGIKHKPVMLSIEEAKEGAESAITKTDIASLRTVINHTKEDIISGNIKGFSLLEDAVEMDKYNIVYYLIMRGANPNKLDVNGEKLINKARSPGVAWLLNNSFRTY